MQKNIQKQKKITFQNVGPKFVRPCSAKQSELHIHVQTNSYQTFAIASATCVFPKSGTRDIYMVFYLENKLMVSANK